MSDEIKRLLETRRIAGTKSEPRADDDSAAAVEIESEKPCYSVVSADRLRVMLELRYKSGNAEAFAYSFLFSASMNPSKAITLDFGGKTAKITGVNLRPLFDALVSQRVTWVQEIESEYTEVTLAKDEVRIDRIEVADSSGT